MRNIKQFIRGTMHGKSGLPRYQLGAFAVVFAVVGSYLLFVSHAATPAASVETEAGLVSASASIVADSSASGGSAVKFSTSGGVIRTLNCVPVPSATMSNTVSHLCGFPDSTNTGVPAGTTLVNVPGQVISGPGWSWNGAYKELYVDVDGTVINGLNLAGTIVVRANNVTIKNTKIIAEGESVAIGLSSNVSNTLIQDVTITGTTLNGPNRLMVGIKDIYGNATGTQVYRCDISYTSTGIQTGNGVYQDNYIHDFGFKTGDHINGITVAGGDLTSMIMRHNTILNQIEQTDAIALFQDFGNEANKTVDNNLLAGGGYTVYGGGSQSHDLRFTNNHFSRLFYPNSGSYGPGAYWDGSAPGNVWSSNIWDDSGATVPAP